MGIDELRAQDRAKAERRRIQKRQTKRKKRERAASRPRPALCECCSRPPGARGLAYDHDHVTGAFRGWLCHRCNLGLGLFDDNPEGLRAAAAYLDRACNPGR